MSDIYFVAVQRDLFDYFATGITLLLSVIAVFIAVSTARKQNKIALFEKRFVVYRELQNSIAFAEFLDNDSTSMDFIERYNFVFSTNFATNDNSTLAWMNIAQSVRKIVETLHQAVFLFPSICESDLSDITNQIEEISTGYIMEDKNKVLSEIKKYKEVADVFSEKHLGRIEKSLCIGAPKSKI